MQRKGARRVALSHFSALLTLCLAVLVAQIDTALGAVYAVFSDASEGLRCAMLLGGVAQLSGALYAWLSTV